MIFRNREEAGRQLAQHLLHLDGTRPVVLALPRGGVPVALPIAEALDAPLDLLLVRKIGAPGQPEFGIGAVVDGHQPEIVVNDDVVRMLRIPESYVADQAAAELREIERRRAVYLKGRQPTELRGRTVIIVDDGIATGGTARVALQALARAGAARRVLAVPVAPADTAQEFRGQCDEAVFLDTPAGFGSVGAYYQDFCQLDDAEVIELLDRAASRDGIA